MWGDQMPGVAGSLKAGEAFEGVRWLRSPVDGARMGWAGWTRGRRWLERKPMLESGERRSDDSRYPPHPGTSRMGAPQEVQQVQQAEAVGAVLPQDVREAMVLSRRCSPTAGRVTRAPTGSIGAIIAERIRSGFVRKAERLAKRRRAQMQQESRSNNRGRLPAAPLHAFLWRRVMEMEEPSWAELAETCGVPDRSIRRVLVQEN